MIARGELGVRWKHALLPPLHHLKGPAHHVRALSSLQEAGRCQTGPAPPSAQRGTRTFPQTAGTRHNLGTLSPTWQAPTQMLRTSRDSRGRHGREPCAPHLVGAHAELGRAAATRDCHRTDRCHGTRQEEGRDHLDAKRNRQISGEGWPLLRPQRGESPPPLAQLPQA